MSHIHPRFFLSVLGIGLLVLLVSCQPGGVSAPPAGLSTPAAGPSGAAPTSSSAGQTSAASGLNLPDPLAGLPALNSYHLNFVSAVKGAQKGQNFESSLTIEGWVNGADQSELVQQTSTGIQPVYLARIVLNGAEYSQQKAGSACLTAANTEGLVSDPALKLPSVFGAKWIGQETVQGIPALHYQFDEKSVPWQAGQNGKAQGDVWVAQAGEPVLKYTLSIQQPSGDFQGTRTWTYEISAMNSAAQIALPEGCQPLITDIPLMDGATQVVQRSGFQKYTAPAALDQVAKFYQENLTAADWTLLPGIEPAGGKQALEFVKAQPGGGSRFAVITLTEANGQTAVIVQAAKTKKAIVLDPTSAPGTLVTPASPSETPEWGSETETPPAAVDIPADLPQYPGASVMFKKGSMMILQAGDAPEKVTAFYKQEMAKAGFTLDNATSANGLNTQVWLKDQLQIMLVIMQQGSSTQIAITVQPN